MIELAKNLGTILAILSPLVLLPEFSRGVSEGEFARLHRAYRSGTQGATINGFSKENATAESDLLNHPQILRKSQNLLGPEYVGDVVLEFGSKR